ncbi:MAG: hypothetical protein Q8Q36_02045 [bacterium]|nr:hypothetical protein [bacterium]
MSNQRSKSRYAEVLRELGFVIADDGPVPEAMRKAFPTIPDKPIFFRIVHEEDDRVAIVMDETGVCWCGDGDAQLKVHGFVSFDEARSKAMN